MYNESYEEYIRSILGYPNYQNTDFMNTYNNDYIDNRPRNVSNAEIEECYPEIYKIIYPMVCKACMAINENVTEDLVSRITNEVYINVEQMELDTENDKPGYVYYDNSETKWDKVYAYWWGGMAVNSITKEAYYYTDWPGFEMEQIEGTDIYRIVAPFGAQGIIFDSGVTDKEVSEGKDAYQTTDLPYTNALIGKLYKIDTSVEPKADPGSMKTKRRYSEGSWSDYSENN